MLLYLSVFILLLVVLIAAKVVNAENAIVRLSQRTYQACDWPVVSIVVSARNEEASIEQAVTTLLNLDYPHYELLVVNDRSTDRTGEILKGLQASHANLAVAEIRELPPGWLGKCNAMHFGAKKAKGDWILFTDGDVSMKPDTLYRAMAYALDEKADHLSLVPECIMPSWLLHAFVATFSIFFKLHVNPAQIANRNSKAHCGIGAFNLVRADVYRDIGGHEMIRLRPDDDLKLGKIIKLKGHSQRFASGIGLISVPWYPSVAALVRGLEKNAFAGMDYSISKLFFSNVALLVLFVLPFAMIGLTTGLIWWLSLTSCLVVLGMALHNARSLEYPYRYGLFFPIGVLMFLFIVDRAIGLMYWRGGIYWRDSFYSFKDLRSNIV